LDKGYTEPAQGSQTDVTAKAVTGTVRKKKEKQRATIHKRQEKEKKRRTSQSQAET
jgi:hypothetical protein